MSDRWAGIPVTAAAKYNVGTSTVVHVLMGRTWREDVA